ncbi:competence protein CoiA family protein [Nocardia takedensis]|uniref:competence protein CoiA family protein n=1 Tax=Nocardia takedensis TaxID=259390 RepID=UPI003F771F49
MVDKQGRRCTGEEMTGALSPYGVAVDIRDDGIYGMWRSRRGLRCMVCGNEVEVYTSRAKNRFVRHGKNTPAGRMSSGGRGSETYEHAALKYWTRDQLQTLGLRDAQVEPHVGDQYPDIYGTLDGTSYAVEIQWSALDHDTAAARTAGLRAAGCDQVLWVARHCDWIERLPAASISDFDPEAEGGYYLHTGHLAMRQNRSGPRTLKVARCSLPRFLKRWTEGELVWAYNTPATAGWATVTDWEHHTRDQAARLAALRRQFDTQATQLAETRGELHSIAERLTRTTDELTGERSRAATELANERARHAQTRDNLEADLAARDAEHARQDRQCQQQYTDQTTRLRGETQRLTAALEHAGGRIVLLSRAAIGLAVLALLLAVLLWLT